MVILFFLPKLQSVATPKPMRFLSFKPEEKLAESFLFKHGTSLFEEESVVWNALREGNRKALDYIYEKYARLLYGYGGKITRDFGVVEDCIQDLFVELWRKHDVLSQTDSIKPYLLKSLRRKIIRRINAEHRLNMDVLQDDYAATVESPIEARIIEEQFSIEQQEQLWLAISHLSERQREAVYLKFYEKMNYQELSEILEISLTSTYKLIGKAVDALRKSLRAER
jgi:RNA polymerase sigma factor (sigma-70 family)